MSIKEESMNKGKNENKLRENASIVINYTMESVGLKGSQNAMVAINLGTTLRTVIKQTRLEKVANIANQLTEPATMFYACHSATIGKNMNMWYVDSACSNHMISHESLLVNIDKNVKCRVKMGTGDLVQSTGKDTLVIEIQGVTRYIKEVMIVPGLDENMSSVGQMVEHGYWLVFGDNVVEIYGDRQMQDLIASVTMKGNRCLPLSLEYVKPSMANKVTIEELSWLSHKRYGHLNYSSLMLLQDKEMVQDLPRLQVTKHCALAVLQEKHKSQAFNIFKRFKNMVELQSGYQIKKLRSDRGGEYTSLELSKFCEEMGLERQLTMAYSTIEWSCREKESYCDGHGKNNDA
ncbi:hypothetical protein L3X38_002952 [Prunus dulcis]|uniref:Retrovirus-related Pol polyprotein from transposon TNT 1-94-like beta-barrel domain-containing protein n=1 Tax=Prunus dulcis TaxID=3755 RepID=A0AAD4ZLD8_PRUDU|nr:hypothetical protein L3X38_002952 [Prunus dulcis]